jgi:hypothetical protein
MDLGSLAKMAVPLARIAFDAASIEDAGQLAKDGLALEALYSKFQSSGAASITEADLDSAIPAAARTLAVFNAIWKDKTKHADVLAAIKSLPTT